MELEGFLLEEDAWIMPVLRKSREARCILSALRDGGLHSEAPDC